MRTKRSTRNWLSNLLILCILLLLFSSVSTLQSAGQVQAGTSDIFNATCGIATIDGNVEESEWSSAATKTVVFHSSQSGGDLEATIYVMNGSQNLYLGITIADDELSTAYLYGLYGDTFEIAFDDDNSGTLFDAIGENKVSLYAGGPPWLMDLFTLSIGGDPSFNYDTNDGGTNDGISLSQRLNERNHFELSYPLCSGDTHDFCLQPGDTVGFGLKYDDIDPGGTTINAYVYPGPLWDDEADIVISACTHSYLPLITK